MKCRYCDNLNLLPRPTCTHCGEELFPDKDPQPSRTAWEIPRHERPRDPGVERWKSMALSVVVLAVLGGGGFVSFDRWPTREPEYVPMPSPTEVIDSGAPTASTSPLASTPSVDDRKFYVDTFAAAEGYAHPSTEGAAVGELRKGTHYVFCKQWGQRMDRKGGGVYNHWWLLTDLDVVYAGGGGTRAWVPALYLTRWGNDEAKDNGGQDIPECSR